MRVLVVHNHYSSRVPSGENLAVRDEVSWLRKAGVDVDMLEASNDDVVEASPTDRVRHALAATWSRSARRRFEEMVARTAPDVVHVHNPFPLLTASVLAAATRHHLPVIWSVHNRRIVCVGGGYFRDGETCTRCRPGWRAPGIRFGCYNQSPAASALVTVSSSIYRSLARRRATAVAPSAYVRDWLTDVAGFDAEHVRLKYNGVGPPPPGTLPEPAVASRAFLFVGRLAPYKGISLLLDAWSRTRGQLDAQLRIVGDGSQADEVRAAAAADSRIVWLGALPPEAVLHELAAVRALVVPSVWQEPFGRVAAEALAYRRAVVTTGLGGLSEIVDDSCGWVVAPDASALAATISEVASSDSDLVTRIRLGHDRYEQRFSPAATTAALIDVYEEALARPQTAVRQRME